MIRNAAALIAVLIATAALYWSFREAASLDYRVQLVVFVRSMDPQFRQHGRPTIAFAGAAFYLSAISTYSLVTLWVFHMTGLAPRKRLLFLVPIFVVTAVVIMIVDPYFLNTALPERLWLSYSSVVQRLIPPLYEIYAHWEFDRYLTWIVIIQAVLVYCVATAYRYLAGRRERVAHSSSVLL